MRRPGTALFETAEDLQAGPQQRTPTVHPDVRNASKTLEYGHSHVRAMRGLPIALGALLLGLFLVWSLGSTPRDKHVLGGYVVLLIGFGLLARIAYLRLTPSKPSLVLSRQGILHTLATDKLIPWDEVKDVRSEDIKVRVSRGPDITHRGVTVISVPQRFKETLIGPATWSSWGRYGNPQFDDNGRAFEVRIFPKEVYADPQELRAAVETRWRAFGRDAPAPLASTTTSVPTFSVKELGRQAQARSAAGRAAEFTPLTATASLLLLIAIAVLGTNVLGLWQTQGQRDATARQAEWAAKFKAIEEDSRRIAEQQRKTDKMWEDVWKKQREDEEKTKRFWAEFEKDMQKRPAMPSTPPEPRPGGEGRAVVSPGIPIIPDLPASPPPAPAQAGGHADTVGAIALMPDGRRFVTTGLDKIVKIWSPGQNPIVRDLGRHDDIPRGIAVLPGGLRIVSSSDDGKIVVRSLPGGEVIATMQSKEHAGIRALVLSADGQTLYSAHRQGALLAWDPQKFVLSKVLVASGMRQNAIAVSADGRALVAGGADGEVRVFDAATGELVRQMGAHKGPIYTVALTSDGRHALTGGGDSHMRMWDLTTGNEVRSFAGHTSTVYAVALSPNGQRAATVSLDGTARVWRVDSGETVTRYTGHSNSLYAVAFAADGTVLSGGADRTVQQWRADSGETVRVFGGGQ